MPCNTIVIGHTPFISQSKSSCSPKQRLFIYLIPNTVPSIVCRITLKLLAVSRSFVTHTSFSGRRSFGRSVHNHYRKKRVLWIHWGISCQFRSVICIHEESRTCKPGDDSPTPKQEQLRLDVVAIRKVCTVNMLQVMLHYT